jgi:hypothetical protein
MTNDQDNLSWGGSRSGAGVPRALPFMNEVSGSAGHCALPPVVSDRYELVMGPVRDVGAHNRELREEFGSP